MRVLTLLLPLCIFLSLLFPFVSSAQINAGFVQGIWYSKDPFFADKEVRVYVALRNNADGDLTGKVQFLDNGELIRERSVSALEGDVVDTWTDWMPSYGEHKIEAILTDVVIDSDEEQQATVTVSLAEDVRFVDYDTDDDGVGNTEDADDDNDGVEDEVEIQNGTDPLVYDEPAEANKDTSSDQGNEGGSNDDNGGNGSGSGGGSDGNSDENESEDDKDNNKKGFESFLNDGVAKTALGGITSVSNTIKNTIDTLRANRAARKAASDASENSNISETNNDQGNDTGSDESADGENASGNSDDSSGDGSGGDNASTSGAFGAAHDDQNSDRSGTHDSSIGEVTRSMDEMENKGNKIDVVGILSAVLDTIYGGVLLILSLYFTYPGVVQFTLLFLLLLLLYHFARKLAKRPQD